MRKEEGSRIAEMENENRSPTMVGLREDAHSPL